MLHLIKGETDDLCLKERKDFPDEMMVNLSLEE